MSLYPTASLAFSAPPTESQGGYGHPDAKAEMPLTIEIPRESFPGISTPRDMTVALCQPGGEMFPCGVAETNVFGLSTSALGARTAG